MTYCLIIQDQPAESQDELNAIYEKFVDVLHSQMDMNFKIYDSGNKKMRKGFKKPYGEMIT